MALFWNDCSPSWDCMLDGGNQNWACPSTSDPQGSRWESLKVGVPMTDHEELCSSLPTEAWQRTEDLRAPDIKKMTEGKKLFSPEALGS